MAILLSDVSNTLEKVIKPFIQDNFPKQTILLDKLKRNNGVEFINNTFYAPVRTSRHGGITNLANDGNSLVSGSSATGQASVGVKILTGTFDISKLTIDATKTRKGAVESALTFQARTLASDFARNVNRQYYSDGYGIVAEVVSTSSANLVVRRPTSSLDDTRSTDNYGTVNGDISPVKYIQPGMVLGIGSASPNVGTVSSVSGNTVVLTANTLGTAAQGVYILDGSAQGGGTSEIQGLRLALSSATANYAGVARSVAGWAPQLGTTSAALTLSQMEDVYLSAKEFAQMDDTFLIFVNKTLFKKYGDILTSLRRTVNQTELVSGWTGLEFAAGAGKVGVFLDYDVPDGEVMVVNLDTWTVCQVSDMNWLEGPDGGTLIRRRDAITYQATMVWFTNLLCMAPGANGRLTQKTA
jgi:hypothetical protein